MPLNSPAEHIPGFEYRATVARSAAFHVQVPVQQRPEIIGNGHAMFITRALQAHWLIVRGSRAFCTRREVMAPCLLPRANSAI